MIIREECLPWSRHFIEQTKARRDANKLPQKLKQLNYHQHQIPLRLLIVAIGLICLSQLPTKSMAIFNCLTPTLFRMQHKGFTSPMQEMPFSRQLWSMYPAYDPNYGGASYAQQPFGGFSMKKSLFQPKWRTGLFGGNRMTTLGAWMGLGGGGNYQRPNSYMAYNYGVLPNYNHMSNQMGSYSYPMNTELTISQKPLQYNHDTNRGWSSQDDPYSPSAAKFHQSQVNIYDSSPARLSAGSLSPILNSYGIGATKGGAFGSNKLTPATVTKNLLVANGGYNFHDSHLMGANLVATNNNITNLSGYSYPELYSTINVSESPAKIAQQLISKLNNQRYQRLEIENDLNSNKLISLIGNSDEPKFVGFGRVLALDGFEARLTCSFGEEIDQENRPIWVKFSGPLSLWTNLNATLVPSFNCTDSKCRVQQIESSSDYRFSFENTLTSSTLIIRRPRISDFGIYRCSALTKGLMTKNLPSWETAYQIIRFNMI